MQRTPFEVAVLLVLEVVDVKLVSDLVVFEIVVSVYQLLEVQQRAVADSILLVDQTLVLPHEVVEPEIVFVLLVELFIMKIDVSFNIMIFNLVFWGQSSVRFFHQLRRLRVEVIFAQVGLRKLGRPANF